jgi:hypothetical protein
MTPPDLGPEEVQRMRRILNPGHPSLPADPLSALLSRNFIDERMYNAGRYFSALVVIARRGWDLRNGSVAQLCRRMVAGIVGEEVGIIPVSAGNGHDRAAADHPATPLSGCALNSGRPARMAASITQSWLSRSIAPGRPGSSDY